MAWLPSGGRSSLPGPPAPSLAWPLAKLAVFAVCALALVAVTGPLIAAPFFALALLSITLGGTR